MGDDVCLAERNACVYRIPSVAIFLPLWGGEIATQTRVGLTCALDSVERVEARGRKRWGEVRGGKESLRGFALGQGLGKGGVPADCRVVHLKN